MEYAHGKIMVKQEDLNLALDLADEAQARLSRLTAGGTPPADVLVVIADALVALAREAKAMRMTIAMLADEHEFNADRRADR